MGAAVGAVRPTGVLRAFLACHLLFILLLPLIRSIGSIPPGSVLSGVYPIILRCRNRRDRGKPPIRMPRVTVPPSPLPLNHLAFLHHSVYTLETSHTLSHTLHPPLYLFVCLHRA
jgi:hypothetical protein